jgi:hypothetical protein
MQIYPRTPEVYFRFYSTQLFPQTPEVCIKFGTLQISFQTPKVHRTLAWSRKRLMGLVGGEHAVTFSSPHTTAPTSVATSTHNGTNLCGNISTNGRSCHFCRVTMTVHHIIYTVITFSAEESPDKRPYTVHVYNGYKGYNGG